MKPKEFCDCLKYFNIDSYYGVPDSILSSFCDFISTDEHYMLKHIVTANEGNAIGLAAGEYLSTGKPALVFLQNSGLGNCINPLVSLAHKDVYSIPILLLIGWRGEPDKNDQPQHLVQGKITLKLLDLLDIKYEILSDSILLAEKQIAGAVKYMNENNSPFALVVKKETFEKCKPSKFINPYSLTIEEAITFLLSNILKDDVVLSTTGHISRELFEYREKYNKDHTRDFLNVGAMGHTSQIALGVAKNYKKNNVICFDGDGASIMHLGSLAIIGQSNCKNFKHILFNNGAHESVGGIKTVGFNINFCSIAKACGYKNTWTITNKHELEAGFVEFLNFNGPVFMEIRTCASLKDDLGRPSVSLQKLKQNFIEFLNDVK